MEVLMHLSTAPRLAMISSLCLERYETEEDFSEVFYTIQGTSVGVDPVAIKVYFNGDDQAFRPREVMVLDQLAKNFDEPVSTQLIAKNTNTSLMTEQALRSAVGEIRRRFKEGGILLEIDSTRGVGYIMKKMR